MVEGALGVEADPVGPDAVEAALRLEVPEAREDPARSPPSGGATRGFRERVRAATTSRGRPGGRGGRAAGCTASRAPVVMAGREAVAQRAAHVHEVEPRHARRAGTDGRRARRARPAPSPSGGSARPGAPPSRPTTRGCRPAPSRRGRGRGPRRRTRPRPARTSDRGTTVGGGTAPPGSSEGRRGGRRRAPQCPPPDLAKSMSCVGGMSSWKSRMAMTTRTMRARKTRICSPRRRRLAATPNWAPMTRSGEERRRPA